MSRPLVYEINTRCWLRDLSRQRSSPIHLGNVPAEVIEPWPQLGFTHVWLMGAWSTGPRSRQTYLDHPDTTRHLHDVLPDWTPEDVDGSPYAISRYEVPAVLGGEAGLRAFRRQLNSHGLGLLLDFVPNHTGLDHPWLAESPELFVSSPHPQAGTFQQQTVHGPVCIAHGRDPFFAPWTDTAQLDYRREDTRRRMIQELHSLAARCDGVRCDMAMLLLNEVFARTWQAFPPLPPALEAEFWPEACAAVKRPDFLLVAEAYWDLEPRLLSAGFDYAYDKRVTDLILGRRWGELQQRLTGGDPRILDRGVHFLENHDEPRAAALLSEPEHRQAALLLLALPGLSLLHEGQLTGARIRVPVHLNRRPAEPTDPAICAWYERLLSMLRSSAVGRGQARVLRPQPVTGSAGDAGALGQLLLVQWQQERGHWDVVALNFSPFAASCRIDLPENEATAEAIAVSDRLAPDPALRRVGMCHRGSMELELPAGAAMVLHCSRRS